MIVSCKWVGLIIWKVYIKDQVENCKCVRMCESEWMNERACKWLFEKVRENFEGWLDILEEQQSYIQLDRI